MLAIALIQFINPGDKQAMLVAGVLGVALVALALLFHPAMMKVFPSGQRAVVVLLTLLMMFASFGTMAYVTVASTFTPRPVGARFDTKLDAANVKLICLGEDRHKIQLTWNFVPLSNLPDNGATIFTGLVSLHDESKISTDGAGEVTQSTCAQIASCLTGHYFRQLEVRPLLVRSASSGTEHTITLELKTAVPKNVRVWWEFYQREGIDGGECRFDNRGAAAPPEGIPPVALFDSSGKEVSKHCYRSFGQKTFEITV